MIRKELPAIKAAGVFHELEQYLDLIEEHVQGLLSDFVDWVNEQAGRVPPKDREEWKEAFPENGWLYKTSIPKILHTSDQSPCVTHLFKPTLDFKN